MNVLEIFFKCKAMHKFEHRGMESDIPGNWHKRDSMTILFHKVDYQKVDFMTKHFIRDIEGHLQITKDQFIRKIYHKHICI